MGRMYYDRYKVNVSSRKSVIKFEKLLMYDIEDISRMFKLSFNTVARTLQDVEEDGLIRYKESPDVDTRLWSGETLKNLIKQGKFFNSVPLDTIFYKRLPSDDKRVVFQSNKSKGSSWGYRNTHSSDVRRADQLLENTVTISETW